MSQGDYFTLETKLASQTLTHNSRSPQNHLYYALVCKAGSIAFSENYKSAYLFIKIWEVPIVEVKRKDRGLGEGQRMVIKDHQEKRLQ